MSTHSRFLLVSDFPDDYGNQVLQRTLVALGTLQVIPESDTVSLLQKQTYDIVVVDAGAVANVAEMVSQIHTLDPDTKIIVVTASKHWKIAKAVIRAGATDYLSKSLSEEEMLKKLQDILE